MRTRTVLGFGVVVSLSSACGGGTTDSADRTEMPSGGAGGLPQSGGTAGLGGTGASAPDAGPPEPCVPRSCLADINCGQMDDGCGGLLDCGDCARYSCASDNMCRPACLTGPAATAIGGTIRSPEELARLEGVTTITDHLRLWMAGGDLLALSCLTTIEGPFDVNGTTIAPTNLTSLVGLENLRTITQRMTLGPTSQLTDLSGLQGLESVPTLTIEDNAALRDVSQLRGLTSGDIRIHRNPQLENTPTFERSPTFSGRLFFSGPALSDLSGLLALAEVTQGIRIGDSTELVSLAGLDNLVTAGDVYIDDNPALVDLESLQNLQRAQRITLERLPLSDLSGLESLTSVGALSIRECGALQSLQGLQNLRSEVGLEVRDNPSLTSLVGMQQVTTLGSLHVGSNAILPDLSGLEGVDRVIGSLFVQGNPMLTSLDGLGGLVRAGELHLDGNAQLTDLTALSGLESVDGELAIGFNTTLSDLTGLESVGHADPLYIFGNSLLSHCEAARIAASIGTTCQPSPFVGVSCSGVCTCDGNDNTGTCF